MNGFSGSLLRPARLLCPFFQAGEGRVGQSVAARRRRPRATRDFSCSGRRFAPRWQAAVDSPKISAGADGVRLNGRSLPR